MNLLRRLLHTRHSSIQPAKPEVSLDMQILPMQDGQHPWERGGLIAPSSLLMQWLMIAEMHDQRRFLQQFPELLNETTESQLRQQIATTPPISAEASPQQPTQATLSLQLGLFRDIRAQLAAIPTTSDDTAYERINQAILHGYIDWGGGFMADIPLWLNDAIRQDAAFQESPTHQASGARVTLWQQMLKRAETEHLPAEIIAEIKFNIVDSAENIHGDDRIPLQESAIQDLQSCLLVYARERYPHQWGRTQINLANAYLRRVLGERAENIERAIAGYLQGLATEMETTTPNQWAIIQNNLGFAYHERIRGDKSDNQEQAITYYQAALRIRSETLSPYPWAGTQNNLGNAYQQRIRGEKVHNQELSIDCYQAALRVHTETTTPDDWAKTQTNLGNAYLTRITGSRSANLEEAITCYQAALRVRTEATLPSGWAATQLNLGAAYLSRIVDDKAQNLELALHHFSAALQVFTPEQYPQHWVMTQHNLGGVYFMRLQDDEATNQELAISHFTSALRIATETAWPYQWAKTLVALGIVYQARLQGNKADNLEQALLCYEAALRVRTADALPFEWIETVTNLGIIFQERIQGDKAANLEQAIVCYQAALTICTENTLPIEWARLQQNLAIAYLHRVAGERDTNLEQSTVHFQAALRVYTEEAMPREHRAAALQCAEVLGLRKLWHAAHLQYLSALRTEDALFALAGGAKGQDVVLAKGRAGPIFEAYVQVQLGDLEGAFLTLERGRARGLAAARALDTADPTRITDPVRRATYLEKFQGWQSALAAVQQPERPLPRPEEVPPEQREEVRRLRDTQQAQQLLLAQHLSQAKTAFEEIVQAIRVADDPADFLGDNLTTDTLFAVADHLPSGHVLVALVPTPWGGVALGLRSLDAQQDTAKRYISLDLPQLSYDALFSLIAQHSQGKVVGGFHYAQAGTVLGFMRRDWADLERAWDGQTPLWEWEEQDAPRHTRVLAHTSFRDMAESFQTEYQQRDAVSTLDRACQDVLQSYEPQADLAMPWSQLEHTALPDLRGTVRQAFLQRELEACLMVMSDIAMRPLARWLRELGVTSVTIMPCGYLAAFPLLGCELQEGVTFADTFSASVTPSVRALFPTMRAPHQHRQGVATIGNPMPTHQALPYGEAEALTLVELGGNSARCYYQEDATRSHLLECLRTAEVVDVSCHGAVAAEYLQSRLILADDTITLGDILNRQLTDLAGLRLLILSACQSAIPDLLGATEEVRSLAVGMLQAGSAATIAALWPVDDRATYLLIVRFAQEWFPTREHEPPAAALARAQVWLRNATWHDLEEWSISAERRGIRFRDMQEKTTLRGGGYPPLDERNAQDILSHARYTVQGGQNEVRDSASLRTDPDEHPYAHPIFWAGFQTTGW